jgi:hypothetical protein
VSWVITYSSTVVAFPLAPQSIEDSNDVNKSHAQVEGQQSIVVSEGLDVRTLTLKGFFWMSGQNKAYLDTNFCNPLQGLNGKVVTLTSPTTRYNGTWMLIVRSIVEKAEGLLQRYTYSLVLEQGASFIVLTEP